MKKVVIAVKWTPELPRESGIYLFMDYLDTLAEEISIRPALA